MVSMLQVEIMHVLLTEVEPCWFVGVVAKCRAGALGQSMHFYMCVFKRMNCECLLAKDIQKSSPLPQFARQSREGMFNKIPRENFGALVQCRQKKNKMLGLVRHLQV